VDAVAELTVAAVPTITRLGLFTSVPNAEIRSSWTSYLCSTSVHLHHTAALESAVASVTSVDSPFLHAY